MPITRRQLLTLLAILASTTQAYSQALVIDSSRARNLSTWKPQIAAYSARHYGHSEWRLKPTCIVLHYTASTGFPWNLVQSTSSMGEAPGLASHYVVDGRHVWQILPSAVRSRGAYGINHHAINIEMVGADARDLAGRRTTMDTASQLVVSLMKEFQIPTSEIYSHQQVAMMNRQVVPWVLDLVDPSPYGKSDPGSGNMKYILHKVKTALQTPKKSGWWTDSDH